MEARSSSKEKSRMKGAIYLLPFSIHRVNMHTELTHFIFTFCLFLFFTISSCSNDGSSDAVAVEETDTVTGVFKFLAAKSYSTWAGDSAVRAAKTGSPHGKVRTFTNKLLKDSLADFTDEHPVGSIAVKELYSTDGLTLKGHSFSKKIEKGTEETSWLWYSDQAIDTAEVDYFGEGLEVCSGCHGVAGKDFVKVTFD